jgi:phosphatidylserine decarboxylase
MNGGWAPAVRCVQPGGGLVPSLASWCGRWRRAWLRRWRPDYVAWLHAARTATCADCDHDVIDGRDLLWVQNVCGVRLPAPHLVSPFRDRCGLVRLGRGELLLAAAAGAALAALLAWLWLPLAWLGSAPLLFALWFFRSPPRTPPEEQGLLVAPADGVLDDLRHEAECPFFPGPALRLGIYLSLFDVHVQRIPHHGVVRRSEYRPGRHVPTVRRGVTDGNEQLLTWLTIAPGVDLVVRQVAGPLARRICSVLAAGERVATGQPFGLIKFGSRVELWLPAAFGARLTVAVGQRLVAGETVIARAEAAAAVTAAGAPPRAAPS